MVNPTPSPSPLRFASGTIALKGRGNKKNKDVASFACDILVFFCLALAEKEEIAPLPSRKLRPGRVCT